MGYDPNVRLGPLLVLVGIATCTMSCGGKSPPGPPTKATCPVPCARGEVCAVTVGSGVDAGAGKPPPLPTGICEQVPNDCATSTECDCLAAEVCSAGAQSCDGDGYNGYNATTGYWVVYCLAD
jgi:hypothetical protein